MTMHVEKAERSVGELLHQISHSEIKLPELQRDFVWKPTQVAKFLDSIYRGYPYGSLLFWETDEDPGTRPMDLGHQPLKNWKAPLYLVDGQQRLTSLYRVFHDHPEAQIVFSVDVEQFKNQTVASRNDPKWIKVADVVSPGTGLLKLVRQLKGAGCTTDEDTINDRLTRLRNLANHKFHLEILRGYSQRQMAEIFIRVNSGGRHLDNLDLALAMLSADWPGVVERLQGEANAWRRRGYGDIDVNFLARALSGAAMGRGLASWTPGRVPGDKLEKGWTTVQHGLDLLIRTLKAELQVTRSDVLPSMTVLIPLIVLLGERPEGKLDDTTRNAIVYWFLVATIRDRYSGASDTKLANDIRAARRPKALEAMLADLGVDKTRPQVTEASLKGRTKESPYFFLSLLVTHLNGARDWWYGTNLMAGLADDSKLEHHHVHPVATLDDKYERADINDLANLIFISGKANRRISYKSPRMYFPEVGEKDLRTHYIPLDEHLRDTGKYFDFLSERRRLLAQAMTALLDKYRPDWLDETPAGSASETEGMSMRLVLYASAWDPGRVVMSADSKGTKWKASASMEELEQAVNAAGVAGLSGDVEIGGEIVPVEVVEGAVEVPMGPFLVTGTAEEWEQVFERERASARSLASLPQLSESAWNGGDRFRFPVTSTD